MKNLCHNLFQSTILVAAAVGLLLTQQSCKSSGDEPDTPSQSRTIIVYMADNNNLADNAIADLNEMQRGMADVESGRLIVYQQTRTSNPRLMEIRPDGTHTVLKKYDPGTPAVSAERMKEVIADAKGVAPASSYGIVLWSHATGWADDNGTITEASKSLQPLSFGADGPSAHQYKRMSVRTLAKALSGTHFDFIYFDCCHMATVEVAYELRHLTEKIVACPTELGTDGMPYDETLPYLFAAEPELEKALTATFDYYNHSWMPGCCITLINTAALDGLAAVSREALKQADASQRYTAVPYFRTIVMDSGIYDMHDYFTSITATDADLNRRWTEAFNAVVVKSMTTPRVYGLDASDFHGLGSNILSDTNTAEKGGYNLTSWYRDTHN